MWIRISIGALIALSTAGCGSSDSGPAPAAPSSPVGRPSGAPSSEIRRDGHYFGNVGIDGVLYFAQAILTRDGVLHVHIAGPNGAANQIAAQYVGSVAQQDTRLTGMGNIIGHGCATADSHRYCSGAATGEIDGRFDGASLNAELLVTSDAGSERWVLSVVLHRLFGNTVPATQLAGQYMELAAEFATDRDTIMTIDRMGRLFFQSPQSGCTGNGTIAQRPDSSFNVYDVMLTIEACNSKHAWLNGEYFGVASPAANGWEYDSFLLQILLTSPEAGQLPRGIAMSGVTTW